MAYASGSKARVLINASSGVISLGLNTIFVFWLYQYLLSRIPNEEFAIYPVLMTIMMLGPVIISFFAGAVSRNIIVAYTHGRTRDVQLIHSSIVISLTLFVLATSAVGLFAAQRIDHLINVPYEILREVKVTSALIVFDLAISLLSVPFSAAFEVRQRFVLRDLINVATSLIRITLCLALIFQIGPSIVWLPTASLLANAFATALIIVISRKMIPEFRVNIEHFSLRMLRSLLGFGAWTSLGTISVFIQQSAGPLLLNLLSTPVQVTTFFIGSVFDRRIESLMGVALAPVQPTMVYMSATGDWNALGNTYLRGGRYSLWVAMAFACPLFIFAEDFVTLYLGGDFHETADVMRILFAAFPFTYSTIMLSRVSIATGQIQEFFLGAIITSFSVVFSSYILLKLLDLGATGVAFAQTLIYISAQLAFFWPLGLRLTGLRIGDFVRKVLLRGLAPSLGGLVVWLPWELVGLSLSWMGLVAGGLLGALLYFLTAVLFCLTQDEKRGVLGVLRKFSFLGG